jgi:hypothetical protein
MQVIITLDPGAGADLDGFNLTANTGAVTPSTATRAQLLSGLTVTVDNAATSVTATATGNCTNNTTANISGIPGPTTTTTTTLAPPTTTTTTTAGPTTTTTTTLVPPTSTTSTTSTTTTTAAPSSCTIFDVTIGQDDLNNAVGNTNTSDNGIVYVEYRRCDDVLATVAYGGAGTYPICVKEMNLPNIYFMSFDNPNVPTQSFATDSGVPCP